MRKLQTVQIKFLPSVIVTALQRAQVLKEAFEERMKLAKIVVLDTAGVSSMYANDGGVIVASIN